MDKTRFDEILEAQLPHTLAGTDLPDLGKRHLGLVRDSYVDGPSRAIVTTDRVAAYGGIIGTVPFKGQVQNQLAQYWLEESAEVAPNHLISVPDPSCMIVNECRPIPVTFTVRAYLIGGNKSSLWHVYQGGERQLGGLELPDGMVENQSLPEPIVTLASARLEAPHDAALGRADIVDAELMTAEHFDRAVEFARALFSFGSEHAGERGLMLVQASYEFGLNSFSELKIIGEIHTWDTARYWYADDYRECLDAGRAPRTMDSEYMERWLCQEMGYCGDGEAPELPDAVRMEAARQFIAFYETVTGREFEPDTEEQPQVRVARNLGCI